RDAVGDDRREQRGPQEGTVHDARALRLDLGDLLLGGTGLLELAGLRAELGVGQTTRTGERVLVDDVRLGEGRDRVVDLRAGREGGVVRDGDVLRGELRGHGPPGDATGDDHDDTSDDREQPDHADAVRALSRNSSGHGGSFQILRLIRTVSVTAGPAGSSVPWRTS